MKKSKRRVNESMDDMEKEFTYKGVTITRYDYESLPDPMAAGDLDDKTMQRIAYDIYDMLVSNGWDDKTIDMYLGRNLDELEDEDNTDANMIKDDFWRFMEKAAIENGMKYYEEDMDDDECANEYVAESSKRKVMKESMSKLPKRKLNDYGMPGDDTPGGGNKYWPIPKDGFPKDFPMDELMEFIKGLHTENFVLDGSNKDRYDFYLCYIGKSRSKGFFKDLFADWDEELFREAEDTMDKFYDQIDDFLVNKTKFGDLISVEWREDSYDKYTCPDKRANIAGGMFRLRFCSLVHPYNVKKFDIHDEYDYSMLESRKRGLVKESYEVSDELADRLNSILADEFLAAEFYRLAELAMKGNKQHRLSEIADENGEDELEDHFKNLSEWMQSKGIRVVTNHDEMLDITGATVFTVEDGDSTKDIVDKLIQSEEEAIEAYENLIPETDLDLRVMLCGFLKDEREHLKALQDAKDEMGGGLEESKPKHTIYEGMVSERKVTDKKDWNHYRATNIQWDVDDPKDLEYVPDKMWVAIPPDVEAEGPEAIEEYMSDYITDNGGFCHKGFDIE
jgi:ferritin-like protein